jgi:hypothetical protein
MAMPMSRPGIKIANQHNPASGDPPIVDDAAWNQYIGSFDNSHGSVPLQSERNLFR